MLDTHRNVRDKLHSALVRNEPTDMKYWKLSTERDKNPDGWDHYVKKLVAKGIQPD